MKKLTRTLAAVSYIYSGIDASQIYFQEPAGSDAAASRDQAAKIL